MIFLFKFNLERKRQELLSEMAGDVCVVRKRRRPQRNKQQITQQKD